MYEEWLKNGRSNAWCFENFIQSTSLNRAFETKKQLLQITDRLGLPVSTAYGGRLT